MRENKIPIKVLLVRRFVENPNTASYNRNQGIEKMLKNMYPCVIVKPEKPSYKTGNRYLNSIIEEVSFCWLLRKIFFLTKIRDFKYVVFLRSKSPLIALVTWIISKPLGITLSIERNEYPSVYVKNSNRIKRWLYEKFVLSWHYRLFDVLFIMTDELIKFYGSHVKRATIIRKLPMTVDFDRFEKVVGHTSDEYIFYTGSLDEQKDGIESLIHAFMEITKVLPSIKLKIAGGTKNGKSEAVIEKLISKLSLKGKIELLGLVDRDNIPLLINSSKMLVLPRPDTIQARGGFPTKLGEYLASGKPVIVSNVGEIGKYLSKNEAYFISPDNIIRDLIDTVIEVNNNYERALEIGKNGKQKARKLFSLESNQSIIYSAFEEAVS
ncbi:MAG TPA: glycosyltransferase family 4 protein [Bacteroidales bacterium]|nr:glycosyltransferase family 4 protein [Bacteroidales bacterium]HQK67029.1 glycosyltransferase family 4 protein [Bacteroidales bacterium]